MAARPPGSDNDDRDRDNDKEGLFLRSSNQRPAAKEDNDEGEFTLRSGHANPDVKLAAEKQQADAKLAAEIERRKQEAAAKAQLDFQGAAGVKPKPKIKQDLSDEAKKPKITQKDEEKEDKDKKKKEEPEGLSWYTIGGFASDATTLALGAPIGKVKQRVEDYLNRHTIAKERASQEAQKLHQQFNKGADKLLNESTEKLSKQFGDTTKGLQSAAQNGPEAVDGQEGREITPAAHAARQQDANAVAAEPKPRADTPEPESEEERANPHKIGPGGRHE